MKSEIFQNENFIFIIPKAFIRKCEKLFCELLCCVVKAFFKVGLNELNLNFVTKML